MTFEFKNSINGEWGETLVTMTISVDRNGIITSDIQTHDNSYSEVAIGLSVVREEINRVFAERKNCPYYPANSEAAKRKIIRGETTRNLLAQPPEVQVRKAALEEAALECDKVAVLAASHGLLTQQDCASHLARNIRDLIGE